MGASWIDLVDWIGLGLLLTFLPLILIQNQMDGNNFIEKIGPFGIIGLFICVFIAFAACACLTVHVKYIYTYLCPLKGIRNCRFPENLEPPISKSLKQFMN